MNITQILNMVVSEYGNITQKYMTGILLAGMIFALLNCFMGIWQKDEVEEAKKYGQVPGDPKVWNNPANDQYDADGKSEKSPGRNKDR